MTQMTPKEIVGKLDKFIIGQEKAKRAVAIALRNRWRRMQLNSVLRQEVSPKNILMIGPTGVGKTEIARRVSKLVHAPFLKVEATKFTEVGYVGKEVDSIIRELMEIAIKMVKEEELTKIRPRAQMIAEERVLDALLPPVSGDLSRDWKKLEKNNEGASASVPSSGLRELFRKKLREGSLLDREVEISNTSSSMGFEVVAPPGSEEVAIQLHSLVQNIAGRRNRKRKMTVGEALRSLTEEEALKLLSMEELKTRAIEVVEQNSVVFIDEIDKVTYSGSRSSGIDVSREGVQRDLLPLIEGCSVSTKYGIVRTDHILFIASGAFQISSPSNLIPELQGRLPIRVELKPLTVMDFKKILTEPDSALTKQYQALLKTEGIHVEFSESGIDRIAEIAWKVNDQNENIGARRLYTVLEKLMEELSFSSKKDNEFTNVFVDENYVDQHLEELITKDDFMKVIL